MTQKKRMLAIFPQLPFPEFAGDRQKVNNEIRILSKYFDLDLVIICRDDPSNNDHDFLRAHSIRYKIFQLNKGAVLRNVLSGIARGKSLQVSFFYNAGIQEYVNDAAALADLVFCNLVRVAKYTLAINKPKYIDIVDSLSINYQRSLEKVKSVFWKFIYRYEYKRLERFEQEVIRHFDVSFLINQEEQQRWLEKMPGRKIVWLPQGVKDHLFNYAKTDSQYANGVLFIGKMDYQPNIDAVVWFLENVWPHVDERVCFYIVGARVPGKVKELATINKRVQVLGYMDDPYIVMMSCKAVVSPMQTGGGVQNKILEGMAMGKINITTTLGAASINFATKSEHFLVCDDPVEMASTINEVCSNPDKFRAITVEAKKLAASVYTWDNFEEKLIRNICD